MSTALALTLDEEQKLAHYEGIIERGLRTFTDVGNALAAIRDQRLHRSSHKTFEAYYRDRWQIGRNYANKMIRAASVVTNLGTTVPVLPTNERQARPLTGLQPEQQREIWRRAVATAPGGVITERHVRNVVNQLTRDPTPKIVVPAARKSPRLIVGCAEDLPLDDESVDLMITSPPYNLGGASWPMGGQGRVPRDGGIGYSDHLEQTAYEEWQVDALREMYRVAKPGASLFYVHKVRTIGGKMIHPTSWLSSELNPWNIRQELIWDRGSTFNHTSKLFWLQDERIYWLVKGPPMLPNKPIGLPTVWRFPPAGTTWHPAPFPEDLPRRCIEAVGSEGITVLDTFAGSCTTLRVALEYGYDAIGVDVNPEFLARAARENGWTNGLET